MKLNVARWFERGWERAIDARAPTWTTWPMALREKLTNRWSLSAANEIVASGKNIPTHEQPRGAGTDNPALPNDTD